MVLSEFQPSISNSISIEAFRPYCELGVLVLFLDNHQDSAIKDLAERVVHQSVT